MPGIRPPGISGGIDPKLVDKLVEVEKIPIDQAKARRTKVQDEKKEVEKFQSMLSELDTACNSIKTQTDFYKMKVDSSHPDILEGSITGVAMLGNYEFEVRGLAKSEKELAYGFPDKDQTPVGFGYMEIERADKSAAEVVIEPGSTLEDVARHINELDLGVRAMVINTKYKPESYRLLVLSEESGQEARIHIDEDTTFLEFKEQVTGRNLDVLFEDVPVTSTNNFLDELLEGVKFTAKRAEPGTRIQVSISHDIDKTIEGIKGFVEKYNAIAKFASEQSKSPSDGEPGKLSGDGSVKSVMRQLQSSLFPTVEETGGFRTLSEVGITTETKTGELKLDEAKVRKALTEDYDSVAKLFIRSKVGEGVGERVAQRLKAFRDPASGMVRSRLRGLQSMIDNQDRTIANKERLLAEREQAIRRRFSALDGQMAGLNAQSQFLAAKLGGEANNGSQGGG